jgi:Domain of unknown function (DUF4397)
MNRRLASFWSVSFFMAFLLSACGGGSSSDSASASATTTQLRLVNATSVGNLQFTATNSSSSTATSSSSVDVGAAGSYVSLTSGTYSVFASDTNNALSTSSTTSLTLSAEVSYTLVAYARGGQIRLLTLTDNQSKPSSDYASVTVANAGSDAGALDVYLLTPGGALTTDLSPTFSSVTTNGISLTNSVTAGSYDIVVTGYSKPTDVRLRMSSVTLTSTGIFTLALTGTTGGTLVDGALIEQGGSVAVYRAENARVRVVAAFPAIGNSNAVVAATVNGIVLNSVTAPAVGTYKQVASNSTGYTISVNGVVVPALPAATFTSGGDYTLLVYGADPANAAVTVITDNNQTPSSGAKIRVINGAAASLSLSANYVPLFSDLGYGSDSEYSGVTAGSNLLRLTSPVTAFTTYSTTISLLSGGVYSLFVIGSADDAIEVLIKDK